MRQLSSLHPILRSDASIELRASVVAAAAVDLQPSDVAGKSSYNRHLF